MIHYNCNVVMNYNKALCWSGRNTVFLNTISRGERPRLNEALDLPQTCMRSGFKLMSGFVSLHYACITMLMAAMTIIYTSEFMAVNLRGRGRSPEAKDGV